MSEGAPSSDCRWRRSEYSYFSKNKPAGNRENPGNQSQRESDHSSRHRTAFRSREKKLLSDEGLRSFPYDKGRGGGG